MYASLYFFLVSPWPKPERKGGGGRGGCFVISGNLEINVMADRLLRVSSVKKTIPWRPPKFLVYFGCGAGKANLFPPPRFPSNLVASGRYFAEWSMRRTLPASQWMCCPSGKPTLRFVPVLGEANRNQRWLWFTEIISREGPHNQKLSLIVHCQVHTHAS